MGRDKGDSLMATHIDMGGLRNLGSRFRAYINGAMAEELKNTVLTEIMPNVVGRIFASAGVVVPTVGYDERNAIAISGGASGVEAKQTFQLLKDPMNSGSRDYAKFALVRQGNVLSMIVDKEPQSAGQQSVQDAIAGAMDEDTIKSLVIYPALSAIRRARGE